MSNPEDEDYVGKGRPPRHRQFVKGVSGNPKGRPKKVRPDHIPPPQVPFMAQMIMKSAFEAVRVKKADGSVGELTSIEAVLHAMKAKALGGNSFAQKTYLDAVRHVEGNRLECHAKLAGSLVMLKLEREEQLERWLQSGGDERDFPLHPEDIQIDVETGDMTFDVAMTRAEREARSRLVDFRDRLGALLDQSSDVFSLIRVDDGYAAKLKELADTYDEVDALLPPRFRKPRPA